MSEISSVLNKAYSNLDFETKVVKIHWKLSEIYYLQVEHSKFQILVIFEWSIFQILAKNRSDSYNICSML